MQNKNHCRLCHYHHPPLSLLLLLPTKFLKSAYAYYYYCNKANSRKYAMWMRWRRQWCGQGHPVHFVILAEVAKQTLEPIRFNVLKFPWLERESYFLPNYWHKMEITSKRYPAAVYFPIHITYIYTLLICVCIKRINHFVTWCLPTENFGFSI